MVEEKVEKRALRIRPAETRDLAAITACAEAAYAKYVARIGRKPAPMVADFESQIAAGEVHVAVAWEGVGDEEFLGYVVCYPKDGLMHLGNVAVRPEAQGRGAGRALIDFVEDKARADGLPAVDLYTNAKMTENLALYPALGFRETDRRTEDGFDRVFFIKELAG